MNNPAQESAKHLLFEPLIKTGLTALKTAVPVLALPVISQIVDWVVMKYMGVFYDLFMTEINIMNIAIKTKDELDAYKAAKEKFLNATTPEEKKNAKEKFHESLRDLISMRPAS